MKFFLGFLLDYKHVCVENNGVMLLFNSGVFSSFWTSLRSVFGLSGEEVEVSIKRVLCVIYVFIVVRLAAAMVTVKLSARILGLLNISR